MGKPTFDLCYSEEAVWRTLGWRHTPAGGKRSVGGLGLRGVSTEGSGRWADGA